MNARRDLPSRLAPFRYLLGLAALACAEPEPLRSPSRPVGACSGARTVSDRDLRNGATALCDTQHLVAQLRPQSLGANALGMLRVPLRVTKQEQRAYCFSDDNGESHEARILDDTGAELLSFGGSSPCSDANFPVGGYFLEVIHAVPGSADSNVDVLFTRLETTAKKERRFVVSSNACPGCHLDGATWPALSGDETDATGAASEWGFSGDFHGATFQGSMCSHDEGCTLRGNFDDALVGGSVGQLRLDGTFSRANLSELSLSQGELASNDVRLSLRGTFLETKLPNIPEAAKIAPVHVELLERPLFDSSVTAALTSWKEASTAWSGRARVQPALNGGARTYQNASIDFATMDLDEASFPAVAGGELDMKTTSFFDCSLRNLPFRVQGLAVRGVGGTFTGSTFADGELDVRYDSPSNAFVGTVLESIRVGPVTAAATTPSTWSLQGVSFNDARLQSVVFRTDASTGALLSGATFVGATLDDVWLDDAALVSASFERARVSRSSFERADLKGASFSGAKLAQTSFASSRLSFADFCGAGVSGTDFSGSRLPQARFGISAIAGCAATSGIDGALTSADTVCPSGVHGLCKEGAWDRGSLPLVCCDPRAGACGALLPTSVICTQSCQCESASCVAGACEAR